LPKERDIRFEVPSKREHMYVCMYVCMLGRASDAKKKKKKKKKNFLRGGILLL
jgi:hypothetical protein